MPVTRQISIGNWKKMSCPVLERPCTFYWNDAARDCIERGVLLMYSVWLPSISTMCIDWGNRACWKIMDRREAYCEPAQFSPQHNTPIDRTVMNNAVRTGLKSSRRRTP